MAGHERSMGDKGGMVSVRLGADERALVDEEAGRRDQTLSQFMREALLEKCGVAKPQVTTFSTTSSAVVGLTLEADEWGRLVPKPAEGDTYFKLVEGVA